jgi:hypothetical protein
MKAPASVNFKTKSRNSAGPASGRPSSVPENVMPIALAANSLALRTKIARRPPIYFRELRAGYGTWAQTRRARHRPSMKGFH